MDNQFNQQGNPYQQGNYNQQGYAYGGNGYGNYSGSTEPRKAPNIFQQFAFSFVPAWYDRLTKVKTGSMIGFVTLLVLAATLISFVSVVLGLASIDVEGWADQLPEFLISDGRLYMEEDFLYDEGDLFVYITEDIEEFSYEDAAGLADDGYRNIILVGRDGISMMQNREYQQADFSDLGDSIEISREWIVSTLVPLVMVGVVLGYLIFFVLRVCWYFLCAAVYLLFAMLIASVMKKELSSGALFRTAVYAKVLMFVVATFLDLLPIVNLSVPFLLRAVITVGFMGFAIAKLPDSNPTPTPMTMGQGWQ